MSSNTPPQKNSVQLDPLPEGLTINVNYGLNGGYVIQVVTSDGWARDPETELEKAHATQAFAKFLEENRSKGSLRPPCPSSSPSVTLEALAEAARPDNPNLGFALKEWRERTKQ